jgi:sialic acid synthase SpsE
VTADPPVPWHRSSTPLLVAEIGGNHQGDYAAACHLCDLALDSGVDYVKFQVYTGDTLVSPREAPDRHAHFTRFELTPDQHLALAERCRAAGVGYCASVWDPAALDWIDDVLDFYKIGSGDLTAWPILERFAERGKPMVLSTGLATLHEVVETVAFLQSANARYREPGALALLQCTAMYPIDDGDANLLAMETLHDATGLDVGYSDHTRDGLALLVAAARGARILEFHFTDSREGKVFRDHSVSLTREETLALRAHVSRIPALLGDGVKQPMPSEVQSGHVTSFRRALYSRRPLCAGELLQSEDLMALRPNHGIDARSLRAVVGGRVRRDAAAFERLEFDAAESSLAEGGTR